MLPRLNDKRLYIPLSLPLGNSLGRVSLWLGITQVSRRKWVGRLPAVVGAGMALAMFVSSAGIHLHDLVFVLWSSLVGLLLVSLRNK